MERFDVDCRYTWLGLGCRPEYRGSSFEQQRLPGRDLVRMDVELLRQLGQRLLALDGGQSHLCFESRAVIPARSSRHRLSCSRAILAALRQKLHSSACPNLLSQLSVSEIPVLSCTWATRAWLRIQHETGTTNTCVRDENPAACTIRATGQRQTEGTFWRCAVGAGRPTPRSVLMG